MPFRCHALDKKGLLLSNIYCRFFFGWIFYETISMLVYFYRLSVKIMGVITLVRICFVFSFFFITYFIFLCVKSAFVCIDFMTSRRNRYGRFLRSIYTYRELEYAKVINLPLSGNINEKQEKKTRRRRNQISVYRPPKIWLHICYLAPFLLSPIYCFIIFVGVFKVIHIYLYSIDE